MMMSGLIVAYEVKTTTRSIDFSCWQNVDNDSADVVLAGNALLVLLVEATLFKKA